MASSLSRPTNAVRDSAPASSFAIVFRLERTVLTQDRLVQLAELPTWLDAEALDECMPRRLVGLECLCLAFRAVEGEHQLAARPLSQRMVGDECIELADHGGMTARLQIVFDALLEAHEALFLETRDLCLREPLERRNRRAAGQRQSDRASWNFPSATSRWKRSRSSSPSATTSR